jgi:hypothetical protein
VAEASIFLAGNLTNDPGRGYTTSGVARARARPSWQVGGAAT